MGLTTFQTQRKQHELEFYQTGSSKFSFLFFFITRFKMRFTLECVLQSQLDKQMPWLKCLNRQCTGKRREQRKEMQPHDESQKKERPNTKSRHHESVLIINLCVCLFVAILLLLMLKESRNSASKSRVLNGRMKTNYHFQCALATSNGVDKNKKKFIIKTALNADMINN